MASTRGAGFEWRQVRVVMLVIVAILLLMYGVYRVGRVFDVFSSRYELVTFVPSALGLREGAPVTLAGQRIGQVKEITFIPPGQKRGDDNLRVVLAIAEDVREQIRRDSRAFLRTQGLLGDKFVDIAPGTAGAAILQPGETLMAGESLDLDQFLAQAGDALELSTGIIANLQDITGGLSRGEGTLGLMLSDEELYASLIGTTGELRRTLAELNRSDGTVGRLIRDPSLYIRLNGAVARMDSLTGMVVRGNGSVARMLRSDSVYNSLVNTLVTADSVVSGVNVMVDRMTTAPGTINRLITDPQLYDELLKTIIDVQTLIGDIRQDPKRFLPNIRVDIF